MSLLEISQAHLNLSLHPVYFMLIPACKEKDTAPDGTGLSNQFLKHLQRTRLCFTWRISRR